MMDSTFNLADTGQILNVSEADLNQLLRASLKTSEVMLRFSVCHSDGNVHSSLLTCFRLVNSPSLVPGFLNAAKTDYNGVALHSDYMVNLTE